MLSSLDEQRQMNVMSLLPNLLNRFSQIFMITHLDSIKHQFPSTISADVQDGISIFHND